jgi:hypothetical protein
VSVEPSRIWRDYFKVLPLGRVAVAFCQSAKGAVGGST